MKIIVSSLVFHPDHSGIALYSSDFAFYAAEKGHKVSVVTGFPFYPNWKKNKSDEGKIFRKDRASGVEIYRGYLYVPQNPSTLKRIFQELTFLFFALFNFLRAGKADVIVVFTTPLSLGALGWLFKKIYKSKLIINVQDFQIEAASSLGMLGKLPLESILGRVEKFSYKKANMVSSISEGMVNLIREKEIAEDKLYLWPNWIQVENASDLGEVGLFRKKHGIEKNKKIIAYAGNVGLKQGLSVLIDLAELFKDNPDVLFFIVGEGGDLNNLKEYHQTKKIKNLHFIPFLNQVEYKELLRDADAIFISQKETSKDVYFPSKLLGLMAASKLIFVCADKNSELYKVVGGNKIGMVSEYNNLAQSKNIIEVILNNSPQIEEYKTNAFHFVKQYDRDFVLGNVLQKIESL